MLLLACGVIPAANLSQDKALDVTGVIGSGMQLDITFDYTGMYAFKLDADSVNADQYQGLGDGYTNKTGLRIASWALISNNTSGVTVTVTHDKLTHEYDTTKQLDYYLGVQTDASTIVTALAAESITKAYTGTVAFSKYGIFARLVDALSDITAYPEGYYYSTITITAAET